MLPAVPAAEGSDATAMLIAGLSTAVSAMAALLTTIALAKFGSLTRKSEAQTEKIHELELAARDVNGFMGTAGAKIMALEKSAVTREYLQLLTDGQNRILAEQTETLHEIRERISEIDKSKASRSDLRAARAPSRRTDGPSDSEPPSDPPPPIHPPRPKLPSRPGRY